MLVNRRQDWELYQEEIVVTKKVAVASPRPDTSLKRNYLLFVLLIAVAAMLITIQNQITVRAGYDLAALQKQAVGIEKDNELIRLDIAKLKAPDRIQQIATQQLGMIVPMQTYYASSKPVINKAAPANNQVAEGVLSILSKAEASQAQ